MNVEIHTVTSQVNVADTAPLDAGLVEKIVALVLARLQDAKAAQDLQKHEQEIPPHMTDSRF